MGNPVGTNRFQVLVESVCRSLDNGEQPQTEDFRQLMTMLQLNLQSVLPGGNWVTPGGVKATGAATPAGISFSVTGSNGAYNYAIQNPGNQGKQVWFRISYSTLKSFTKNVTVLPITNSTSGSVNLPGSSLFFQLEASFDQVNWSRPQLASTAAIDSGLVSSGATSNAGAFNQTNYGIVTSVAVGSQAEVQIQGASGPYTSMVAQKGPSQSILPGATIAGVTPGSDLFVGWSGKKYVLRTTLADLLADDTITPIGKVSVVGTGVPTLPTVTPIISGGHIIGLNWTPGAGLSAIPTFTVVDGPGTGAIVVGTGVSAGQLTGMQILNSGQNYDGSTVINAAGGIFPGSAGGGTALGGNGGRLTAV